MIRIGGVFFALWRQLLSREIFLIVFGVIDILVLIGECLRIQSPAINKIFLFVLGRYAPPSIHEPIFRPAHPSLQPPSIQNRSASAIGARAG